MSTVTITLEDVGDRIVTRLKVEESNARQQTKAERFAEALLAAVEAIDPQPAPPKH